MSRYKLFPVGGTTAGDQLAVHATAVIFHLRLFLDGYRLIIHDNACKAVNGRSTLLNHRFSTRLV
jgi:hypothetical protein